MFQSPSYVITERQFSDPRRGARHDGWGARLPRWLGRSLAVMVLICVGAPTLVGCSKDAGGDPVPDVGDVDPLPDTEPDADAPDADTDDPAETTPPIDARDDADAEVDDTDTDTDIDIDTGPRPDPGTRVEIDLGAFAEDPLDPGDTATAFRVTETGQLIPGEAAEGLIGDHILENGVARFLVGFGDRAISPCSYDGNIVDAELKNSDEWSTTGDILGEICLLVNIGQTLEPDRVEIIEDAPHGAAIVAVTGHTQVLDFLNIRQMVDAYAPGLISEFPVDPDRLVPVTITVYYILRPGETSVRVVTAVRNDGDQVESMAFSHMIMSGSTGGYFNPLGATRGFGYISVGLQNLGTDPVPFLAYIGEHSAYAYAPDPDPNLNARLPVGGGSVAISGVAVSTFGTSDVLPLLIAPPDRIRSVPGYQHLEPGEIVTLAHRVYVGDGSVSTIADAFYADRDVPRGEVSGRVVDADGAPVARARVTAVGSDARAYTQSRSGADGSFSFVVPEGTYTIRVRTEGGVGSSGELGISSGDTVALGDVAIAGVATLHVRATTPDGEPTPARISVVCVDTCPDRPTALEMDSGLLPPSAFARIERIGMSGELTLELVPGTYRIMVSRGLTWSTWPSDAIGTGGELMTFVAGDSVDVDAEIAPVVDMTGVLDADFHIHAMRSSDSSVANVTRVLDFLSEGVAVMVSSDHDVVTDFAPAIEAVGAGGAITSIIGNEITTPNIGHFNAFPLPREDDRRKGGPIDWSNGANPNLSPQQLYDAINAYPGEQVIQVNHPAGTGTIGALVADVLTGVSYADRDLLRMPPGETDPETGDTRLWSDDFTAIEVMNGHGQNNFWSAFRWWLTMIGRGFAPTGTAVSDTHGLYGTLGGSPRSFVFVPEGNDTAATMDTATFVRAINEGRLVGSNGPMMRPTLIGSDGEPGRPGDTVEIDDDVVVARILVETPAWMRVDTLDIYTNVMDDLIGDPGEALTSRLAPTMSFPLPAFDDHLELVASGAVDHHRYRAEFDVEIPISADAYVVFVVRSTDATMFPLLSNAGTRPFAWSNPIYVDVDGGGYDNVPLADLRESRATMLRTTQPYHVMSRHERPPGPITPEDIIRIIELASCGHDHDDDHAHDHSHPHPHVHPHPHPHPHVHPHPHPHRHEHPHRHPH